MRLLVVTMAVAGTLLLAPSLRASETPPDASAYAPETALEIHLLPNSLLLIVHGDPGTEFASHATLHRVYATLPYPADPAFAIQGIPLTLYTTGGQDGAVTYAVGMNPLYYGDHLAEDGFPARIWEDPLEDGLNGNEVFIEDNPSAPAELVQTAEVPL